MSDDGDVPRIMAEIADLQVQLQRAYEAGDAAMADRLMSELSGAEGRRNRALRDALATGGHDYRPTLPIREQVARVLDLLGRPAPVSLIREVAAARFGDRIPGPRLASLRRDEHRSWRSAHGASGARAGGRPVYVVPALTYDRLAPVRAMLALSSWPLELRLIAPASHRVDLLYAAAQLAGELSGAGDAPWASDLERLVWRLATAIPGAAEGQQLDPERVRSATARELAQAAEADLAERADAARHARDYLDREQLLFGSRLAAVNGLSGLAGLRDRPGDPDRRPGS